jgi:hypothetical protein
MLYVATAKEDREQRRADICPFAAPQKNNVGTLEAIFGLAMFSAMGIALAE